MTADDYEIRDGVPYLVKQPMTAREAMDESRPLPELARWVLAGGADTDPTAQFEAGYRAALDSIEYYDAERVRLGRALSDDEIRRLADLILNPITLVRHES